MKSLSLKELMALRYISLSESLIDESLERMDLCISMASPD